MDFNEALEKLEDVKLRKLKEYRVRVVETVEKTVYVEAYDYEDAEERVDEISSALAKIYKRMEVEVTFYCGGRYYNIKGIVMDKNDIYKYLVVGEGKIFYDDIYEIKLL